jgi:hypothetical protein
LASKRGGRKGIFGDIGLPVAGDYPVPPNRRALLGLGILAILALAALLAWDELFGRRGLISGGPLSSSHAVFTDDCSRCHDPERRRVGVERCAACHEKFGDELGIYTFARHYVYRSDDFRRVVPQEHEVECAACHPEHRGREAAIARVGDGACRFCHFDSFGGDHPEFDFAAEQTSDHQALRFSHVHHVREVMKRQQLEDPEKACLLCHNARQDGRGFEPLDFDRHCDACHLTATTTTPGLPVLDGAAGGVGVATLESLAESGGPGLRWVYFSNPGEFRRRGDLVVKAPVHHRDPWLLENLRRLRRRLYPDAGLADLLRASADAPPGEVRALYHEAVATLEEQALGLRGRPEPEIQQELERIRVLVETVERRIDEPFEPLDETAFLLAFEQRDPRLDEEEAAAIEALAADLTEPCRGCHEVRNATIVRVDRDQRELRRAEFDHRAHIVQRRCLDCHDVIPVRELLDSEEKPPPELDNSGIHNLPRIDSCRQCHDPRQASDRCVTCHRFHPDKGSRAELLPYFEEAP